MNNFPFSFMNENYVSSKTHEPSDFVTEHWNVFGDDFIKLFDNTEKWSRMLRNAITLGINDSLVKISNKRFSTEGNDYWYELRNKNLKDLMDDPINNEKEITKLTNFFHETATLTSYDYLIDNIMDKVGAPLGVDIEISHRGKDKIVFCNQHDFDDIYHSWEILTNFNYTLRKQPIICEIGCGYGGLISKIKTNLKNAKCILLDLPEVNAIQTYYLSSVFEDAKFLGYKDYLQKGNLILDEDFDFLILPGWVSENLLTVKELDLFINIRSFMEMPKTQIDTYFKYIQNSLKVDGVFACFNRYSKKMKLQENEFVNSFREYPFDDHWSEILSKPSPIQPSIHLLMVKRAKEDLRLNFREKLHRLPS